MLGLGLIGVGGVLLVLIYLIPGSWGGNVGLILGFVLMAGGLVTLSRWQ